MTDNEAKRIESLRKTMELIPEDQFCDGWGAWIEDVRFLLRIIKELQDA